jgi:hypothetical protein
MLFDVPAHHTAKELGTPYLALCQAYQSLPPPFHITPNDTTDGIKTIFNSYIEVPGMGRNLLGKNGHHVRKDVFFDFFKTIL